MRRDRTPRRIRHLPRRVARFVRAIFGGSSHTGWDDSGDTQGGIGVREPRRPLAPTLAGAVELDLPEDDGSR